MRSGNSSDVAAAAGDAAQWQWDFFLAHAGIDAEAAESLFEQLSPRARVFLDSRSLIPGDDWDLALSRGLRQARVCVVLVSPSTDRAYYQREEIAQALDLARREPHRHRVVPVFLEPSARYREDIPYGLRLKHSLSVDQPGHTAAVADALLDLLHLLDAGGSASLQAQVAGRPSPGLLSAATAGFVGLTKRGPLQPRLVTSWKEFTDTFGTLAPVPTTYLSHCVRGFFENGGRRAWIVRVDQPGACEAGMDLPMANGVQGWNLRAQTPGNWGNWIRVCVRDGTRVGFRLTLSYFDGVDPDKYRWRDASEMHRDLRQVRPDEEEDFDNLGWDPAGPNWFAAVIAERSRLLAVDAGQAPPAERPLNGDYMLEDGWDGQQLGWQDYAGESGAGGRAGGLASLQDLDEVSLVCIPDQTHPRLPPSDQEALRAAIIAHCERNQDRFALLDGGWSLYRLDARQADLHRDPPLPDTALAATFFPRIAAHDASGDWQEQIPSVGHVAGLIARNDLERGVHRSPVNLPLIGLVGEAGQPVYALSSAVSDDDVDTLRRLGYSCLRQSGPGAQGVTVASALTMAIDHHRTSFASARFAAYLRRTLTAGLGWVAFESNEPPTWERVRDEVAELLTRLFQSGVFQGDRPEEAWFVTCDPSTMTPDDVQNGRLVLRIGFAFRETGASEVIELSLQAVSAVDEAAPGS